MTPKVLGIIEAAQMNARKLPHLAIGYGWQLRLSVRFQEFLIVRIIIIDDRFRNGELKQSRLEELGDDTGDVHLPLVARAALKNFPIERDHFTAEKHDELGTRRTGHHDDDVFWDACRGNPAGLTVWANYTIHEYAHPFAARVTTQLHARILIEIVSMCQTIARVGPT